MALILKVALKHLLSPDIFFRFVIIIPLIGVSSQQSKIKFTLSGEIIPNRQDIHGECCECGRIFFSVSCSEKIFITHFTKMQTHVYKPVLKL